VSGDGGQVFIRAGQFVLDNAWIWADTYGEQNGRIDIMLDSDMQITNSSEIAAYNYGDNQGTLVTVTANALHLNGVNPDELFYKLDEISQYSLEDLMESGATEQEANLLLDSVNDILTQDENISFDAFLEEVGKETVANFLILFIPILNKITIGNSSGSPKATGGEIRINTPVLTINTGMIEAFTEGPGDAGNIQVDAEQVTLSRFGYIEAATGFYEDVANSASGQAGNMTINAKDKIALSDFSTITVGADIGTTGDAGNINLNTPHLTLNSAQITAYNAGEGDAGSIDITTNTAWLTGKSSIYTEAKNAGGGNITLNVRDNLFIADDSWITAEAFGNKPEDKGGNITISNPALLTIDNSQLRANAYAGNGGNIDINTEQLDVLGESRIDVSSELGLNGRTRINEIELNENFMLSAPDTLKADALLNNRCPGVIEQKQSSFIVINKDTPASAPGNLKTHVFVVNDETY
jgi:lipopolysaccharide export system protein LptA